MEERHARVSTGPSAEVRAEVIARARGRCERCGTWADQGQVHHRKPRQMGGTSRPEINDASNLVLLCQLCHDDVESHRTDAYEAGWLRHSWD